MAVTLCFTKGNGRTECLLDGWIFLSFLLTRNGNNISYCLCSDSWLVNILVWLFFSAVRNFGLLARGFASVSGNAALPFLLFNLETYFPAIVSPFCVTWEERMKSICFLSHSIRPMYIICISYASLPALPTSKISRYVNIRIRLL